MAAASVDPSGHNRSSAQRSSGVRYGIGDQRAEMINNVGRDQHNAYVTHVLQQRESFLREVAAAKSKARVLSWVGGLLLVVGFAGWAYVIFSSADRIPSFGFDSSPAEIFGPEIFGGVRLGMIAMGVMLLGIVLLIVGIVLHVSSAARRRRINRDLPLPFPSY